MKNMNAAVCFLLCATVTVCRGANNTTTAEATTTQQTTAITTPGSDTATTTVPPGTGAGIINLQGGKTATPSTPTTTQGVSSVYLASALFGLALIVGILAQFRV